MPSGKCLDQIKLRDSDPLTLLTTNCIQDHHAGGH